MGLFDFLKNKKTSKNKDEVYKNDEYCSICGSKLDSLNKKCKICVDKSFSESNLSVESKYESHNYDNDLPNSSSFLKELETFTKNGIEYKIIEKTDEYGYKFTYSVAKYNEVLYCYTFMNKYKTLLKPGLIKEYDFSRWTFKHLELNKISDLYFKLCDLGFYGPAENEDILKSMTVSEIKKVIDKLELKIKGKKEELISSLITLTNETSLKNALSDDLYSLTKLGKKWMNDHEEEYKYHISEDEFSSFEEYKKYWSTHDPYTVEMKKHLKKIKSDNITFGRYEYESIINLLKEKEGQEREILVCLGKQLFIDLSGALSYNSWNNVLNWDLKEFDFVDIFFTPYLVKTISKYKDFYDDKIIDEIFTLNLPMNICSKEIYTEIIEMIFEKTLDNDTQSQYQVMLSEKALEFAFNKYKNIHS